MICFIHTKSNVWKVIVVQYKCTIFIISIYYALYKNLFWDIKIIIIVKYWYLVGISRWENPCNTRLLIWVNTIILNLIDSTTILSRYGGTCMVYRSKWHWKLKHSQISIPYMPNFYVQPTIYFHQPKLECNRNTKHLGEKASFKFKTFQNEKLGLSFCRRHSCS